MGGAVHPIHAINPLFDDIFLALQAFVVAFLLLHDWIPLGRLNNLGAIQNEDSLSRRIFVTLLPGVPTGLGLYWSAINFGRAYPPGVEWFLGITYGLLLVGILRAWWIPYLLIPDPERAARYGILFKSTHTFLPMRNGIVPDTLHCVLHLAVASVVILMLLRGSVLGV